MKNRHVLSVFASWFALALTPVLSAQTADAAGTTGAIEGRVQNVVSGRFLPNARVSVPNTDIMVFTDETGLYRIARVPAGVQMIEVFYTGLDTEKVSVRV